MKTKKTIKCPNCHTNYWIPRTNKRLRITCKKCGFIFYNRKSPTTYKKNKKFLELFFYAIIISFFIYFIKDFKISEIGKKTSTLSNWITIDYDSLIDKSVFTHNGETVGEIIKEIPKHTDDFKGEVQQYLEPYSILCNDALLAVTKPDTLPLINIISYYPEGSEQPAWAALFREGHYQIYYNRNLIRVFLEGLNPSLSFKKYHSIIRLPILDIIKSKSTSIKTIEIYVFQNDYASTKIKLNTIPKIFSINEIDLSAYKKSLDLASIESFLSNNLVLEAIEVSGNNLYFYGKKSSTQTLAGKRISLSDIAVVYRSIFHYGYNAPYISLDKNEDNRYAKVNFGGNLQNTHVGSVVLEADKLFKTLSTGIDPNTHKLIQKKIKKVVPDFLTEDARSLIENKDKGKVQIRYWFYPDSIGTVTDGSIGAILKYQFLADIERMDKKVRPSYAVRETINHLNNNFSQYENAFNTFKELSSVGRIMAIINWLKGMNIDEEFELDELLSVKLPAFTTQKKTKKMLAISSVTYPDKTRLNKTNIYRYSKTYYISNLLDKYSPFTSDDSFLKVASDYYSKISKGKNAPIKYKRLKSSKNYFNRLINSNEKKIKTLQREIARLRSSLNNYNSNEVDFFNMRIKDYNILLAKQKLYVKKYNSIVNKLNQMDIMTQSIVSIGGGIDLSPSEFKMISVNRDSPKLREVLKVKREISKNERIRSVKNWFRSSPTNNKTRVNAISNTNWHYSKTGSKQIKYSLSSPSGDKSVLYMSSNSDNWETSTTINGNKNIIKYEKKNHLLIVSHPGFGKDIKAKITANMKEIIFSKK